MYACMHVCMHSLIHIHSLSQSFTLSFIQSFIRNFAYTIIYCNICNRRVVFVLWSSSSFVVCLCLILPVVYQLSIFWVFAKLDYYIAIVYFLSYLLGADLLDNVYLMWLLLPVLPVMYVSTVWFVRIYVCFVYWYSNISNLMFDVHVHS